jgi:hypothetical protein
MGVTKTQYINSEQLRDITYSRNTNSMSRMSTPDTKISINYFNDNNILGNSEHNTYSINKRRERKSNKYKPIIESYDDQNDNNNINRYYSTNGQFKYNSNTLLSENKKKHTHKKEFNTHKIKSSITQFGNKIYHEE